MARSNRKTRRNRKQRGGFLEWLFGKKSPLSNTPPNLPKSNVYNTSSKYQVGNANTMMKLNPSILNRTYKSNTAAASAAGGRRRKRTCRRNRR